MPEVPPGPEPLPATTTDDEFELFESGTLRVIPGAVAVETALESMRTMLAADGYELDIAVDGQSIALDVKATADACTECLVPKPLFAKMAADLLAKGSVPVERSQLSVRYPTED